jgi:phosphoribosylformylglycinamidine synthase
VKLRVRVVPREGVLDPEGRAVHHALGELGYRQVSDVRIGKLIELELATDDPAEARRAVTEMCEKLLANPVIESYEIE